MSSHAVPAGAKAVTTRLWAVVPAAGIGARLGADRPKQYLPLAGRSILQCTLERLSTYPGLQGLLVGISPQDAYWPSLAPTLPKIISHYPGGSERANTVLNGLQALVDQGAEQDWVLVHDAVRPCVRHGDIDKLIHTVAAHPDGGLLASPLTETIKRGDAHQRVLETVPRSQLWRAFTPQLFPVGRLYQALRTALEAGKTITDECAAVEYAGGHPCLVAGHGDNIKITLPGDIPLAERYLAQQALEET